MKIYGLILILFLSQLAFSQSISSYMHNIDKYDKDANISEIIETIIFYNSDGADKKIEYKNFNSSMNLTSLKKFDDENKLIWLRIYTYDSLQRKVRIDTKKWINMVGYESGYSVYKYDSLNNCLQIDYNSQDRILNIAKYYFDKDSNLMRLETYDANGSLFGYETAKYDFENNKMLINQYNNQGKLLNSDDKPIKYGGNYNRKPSNKYNENGDLIFWERDRNKNDKVCFMNDYKYDENGNWILKKRYRFIKTKKGKLKRKKLVMLRTREIKYNE
jgi:hypothetical protein